MFGGLLSLLISATGASAETTENSRQLFYIGDQFESQGQNFAVFEGQEVNLRLDENGHVVGMRYPGRDVWVNTPTGSAPSNATAIIDQLRSNPINRAWLDTWLQSVDGDFSVLSDALSNGDALGWNTLNANEGSLSIPLGDSATVFVKLEPQGGSELEPTLVTLVGEFPSAQMTEAERYLKNGQYAHAAQQALLDAGYDPKGVDGRPGGGARAALEEWADVNEISMPPFNIEFAGQISEILTAPPARFADIGGKAVISIFMVGLGADYNWVGRPDSSDKGNLDIEILGVPNTGEVLQISAIMFGKDGYGFYNQNGSRFDRMPQPAGFDPRGTILLHGRDEARLDTLVRLWAVADTGKARIAESIRGEVAQAIDESLAEAVAGGSERSILWTVVDHLDGANIVAADVKLPGSAVQSHAVIFFADYPGEDRDSLISMAFMREITNNLKSQF